MKDLVKKVAKVARISVGEEEIDSFTKDFQGILNMFDFLEDVDIREEPTFHPIEIQGRFREDVEKEGLTQEEALLNTKNKEKGFFKGPGSL